MGTVSSGGLTIVIPAWNEEERLVRTLDRYLPRLEARGGPFEVLVVADGKADATANVARAYSGRGVRVLEFPEKLGKGGAVLAGLRAAQFDCAGYLDADGPIPPEQLFEMADGLRDVDCVVASRWMRGSEIVRREPMFNLFAGRVWNFLVRSLLFLPIRDTQCGAKFLRRSVITSTLRAVTVTNRAFDVDLLYHVRKAGLQVREVPVTWEHNPETRMPIGPAIPVMLVSLLGMRLMNLPFSARVPSGWVRWFHRHLGQT